MPICRQAPSSISAAQCLPIAVSVSVRVEQEVSLFERLVILYEQVDVVNVDERVSERARNVFIDDGDHRTGALDGGQRGVALEVPSDT